MRRAEVVLDLPFKSFVGRLALAAEVRDLCADVRPWVNVPSFQFIIVGGASAQGLLRNTWPDERAKYVVLRRSR
jgi:hypothetical protein